MFRSLSTAVCNFGSLPSHYICPAVVSLANHSQSVCLIAAPFTLARKAVAQPKQRYSLSTVRSYHVSCSCRKKQYVAGDQLRHPKLHPIMKHRRIILIDEDGSNLGEMDSSIALGMAEGRDLKVEMVNQHTLEKSEDPLVKVIPVFKMATGKALYEEKKTERKKARSSVEIIKEAHIGTKITEHDMGNKIRYIKDMLERGKSVRVFGEVRAKGKWIEPEEFGKEREKRVEVLGEVTQRLEGFGVLAKDSMNKGTKEFALFRPTAELIAKKEERIKLMLETSKKKKRKGKAAESVDEQFLEAMGKELEEEMIIEEIIDGTDKQSEN